MVLLYVPGSLPTASAAAVLAFAALAPWSWWLYLLAGAAALLAAYYATAPPSGAVDGGARHWPRFEAWVARWAPYTMQRWLRGCEVRTLWRARSLSMASLRAPVVGTTGTTLALGTMVHDGGLLWCTTGSRAAPVRSQRSALACAPV